MFCETSMRCLTSACTSKMFAFQNMIFSYWHLIKFFKTTILATNHRRVKRQLFLKTLILFTMRLTMRDAFRFNDFSIIIVLETLRQRCSHLFRNFFSADVDVFEEATTSNHFVENTNHMSSLMHEKIKEKNVTSHELSTSMSAFSKQQFFYQELHVAMLRYNHTSWNMRIQSLYWFDQMNFLNS